jgi:hypothetical protein
LCTLHRRDVLMTKSSIVADNALAARSGEIYTFADVEPVVLRDPASIYDDVRLPQ